MHVGTKKAPTSYNLCKLCNTLQPNAILNRNSALCQQPKQKDWACKKMCTLRHCPMQWHIVREHVPTLALHLPGCLHVVQCLALLHHHSSSKVGTLIGPC